MTKILLNLEIQNELFALKITKEDVIFVNL